MKHISKTLQEALVKNNVLTQSETETFVKEAESLNKPFRDFLIEKEIVTDKQIAISLSQTLGIQLVDFSKIEIDEAVIDKVPVKFVWYYKFMPIKLNEDSLTIVTSSPLDIARQDEIRNHLGVDIEPCLATEKDLMDALKKHYGLASDTIDRIMTKDPSVMDEKESDDDKWVEDIERETEDPTVSNLVNQILLEAYNKRATDIHIEPYRDKVRFRYRIDGVLVDANLPKEVKHFMSPLLSRIKIMANLSITEKRLPQDGSAVVKTSDQHLDLRVSTMPTPRGESMVIRILPTKVMLFSLEKLGFDEHSLNAFRDLIKKPHGIVFITGPTGSGKTTTLYACLNEINSSQRKILTIEDPVEYEMDGITQVQVNPKVKFSFSNGLRSMLRHDPDIIMVGEVRDLETAEIAIRTALTGHLVFSTLHTNDASSGITRLTDMGVEPYLVASSVEAFVAQRLVRVICPHCKEEDPEPMPGVMEEISRSLKIKDTSSFKIYKGKGCDRCNNTGFFGRMAIYEILIINDSVRAAIIEKPRSDYIKEIAMKEGLQTLRQSGWHAVLKGQTTPDEVIHVTVKDDIDEIKDETDSPVETESKEESNQQIKIKKREEWASENEYDARIYPRTFTPTELRYQLTRRDPSNPSTLLSEGVEHTTQSEDISAGGIRFISKVMVSIGSIIEIKIGLDNNRKNINCLAKVCRVEEDSLQNVYIIVAYFLDISSADRSTIGKFVDQKMQEEDKFNNAQNATESSENS